MNCDDQILLDLLHDVELADEHDVSEHIAKCGRCQGRLAELAADEDSWVEAASALRETVAVSSVVIAIDSELPADIPVQADQVAMDFLLPAKHPELLGRIGRYDVERFIGAGGMGIVFKAYDTELHRPVAIKVLAPHLAHSGGARQRFAREAQSAAAVVHENVVPIHNVDAAGKLPFLVMQFVSGESLQSRLDREGPLGTDEVLRIGTQIAKGLAAAHAQGLVHRDVKPGNVLLEEHVDRVLISDFGLARAADDASVTRSGVIAGTPHYMSPEQARGAGIDTRSDLFSLGSVLYFMCSGRPPFRADGAMAVLHRICGERHRPIDEVNEQVPAALANLIDDLLEKEVSRRPRSAEAVANELTTLLHDTRRRGLTRQQRRRKAWAGRWPSWLGVAVALAACVMIGMASFSYWLDTGPTAIPSPKPPPEKSPVVESSDPSTSGVADRPEDSGEARPVDVERELGALRDHEFETELLKLEAEMFAYPELEQRISNVLPLADMEWFDALQFASELTTTLEQGVTDIEYSGPAGQSQTVPPTFSEPE